MPCSRILYNELLDIIRMIKKVFLSIYDIIDISPGSDN